MILYYINHVIILNESAVMSIVDLFSRTNFFLHQHGSDIVDNIKATCNNGAVIGIIKILSSFTHPQVDPNLYECVCSEHKGRYFEE